MKKKKYTKRKSKTDSVHESLAAMKQMILNLEKTVKELAAQIEQLRYSQSRFKDVKIDTKKYWPVDYPKYKDVTWDAIDKGLQ